MFSPKQTGAMMSALEKGAWPCFELRVGQAAVESS
jgi:hypothetical protein